MAKVLGGDVAFANEVVCLATEDARLCVLDWVHRVPPGGVLNYSSWSGLGVHRTRKARRLRRGWALTSLHVRGEDTGQV